MIGGGGAEDPKLVFVGGGGGSWGSELKCLDTVFSFILKRADMSYFRMALECFPFYFGEAFHMCSGFEFSLVES